MSELIRVTVNGKRTDVAQGTTVAAAMLQEGQACRISVSGEPRTAMCGMGICFECRAVVNGVLHRRTCMLVCEPEMNVETE
jgi:hypothetical protein